MVIRVVRSLIPPSPAHLLRPPRQTKQIAAIVLAVDPPHLSIQRASRVAMFVNSPVQQQARWEQSHLAPVGQSLTDRV